MPLVASIPAFLGTAAGAATVVSAGVGLAGAAYSSSQANKAAGRQIDAQQQATEQTLALQRQQYDTTRADQAPANTFHRISEGATERPLVRADSSAACIIATTSRDCSVVTIIGVLLFIKSATL